MPKPLPSVISEEALGTSEYLRLREETLRRFSRRDDPGRRRQDLGPSPRDEFWTLRRSWTGEEYYGPRSEAAASPIVQELGIVRKRRTVGRKDKSLFTTHVQNGGRK